MKPVRVLSVAGSDSGGGAGIQADLKTVTVLGGFGMSVITAITVQNTLGVQDIYCLPPSLVASQFDALATDIGIDSLKTGMLPNREIMAVVVSKIKEFCLTKVVIDPVLAAKRGETLMSGDTITMLKEELLPHALVVTPNIPEAEILSGMVISSLEDMRKAALIIYQTGVGNVVIKGGHLSDRREDCLDILYDGDKFHEYSSFRIDTRDTHGTGCTYASAIATFLAAGSNIKEAVAGAKKYITASIQYAWRLGGGQGPINHLAPLTGPFSFGKGGLKRMS